MPASPGLGHKKVGGRKAGVPNRKTVALEEICAKHSLCVFEGLVLMAKDKSDRQLQFQALKELCSYLYPKRKAVEVSGPDGAVPTVNISQTSTLMPELKNILEEHFSGATGTKPK